MAGARTSGYAGASECIQNQPTPVEMRSISGFFPLLVLLLTGCASSKFAAIAPDALQPRVVTAPTRFDTDDPAIWINPADPAKSLVIGTDKDSDGALYVYDLAGRIVKTVTGLARPN